MAGPNSIVVDTTVEPISGRPYPTLSGKPTVNVFSNPPFHPNVLNIGGGNTSVNPPLNPAFGLSSGGNLERGKLVASNAAAVSGTNNPSIGYEVHFLYNPSTISESRAIDINNNVLPQGYRDQYDNGSYITGLNTSINFSLLFDRTFEMWDPNYIGSDAQNYGCRVDVEALLNLVGVNQPSSVINTTANKSGDKTKFSINTPTSVNSNYTIQGPMLIVPTMLYFGPNNQGALGYYGFISSLDITWTHFSAAMTPMRCAVGVSFTVLPAMDIVTVGG